MDCVEVLGEVAYIVWYSVNQDAEVTLGTDTFVVKDGKIAVQTFRSESREEVNVSSAMAMTSRCIRVLSHHGISLP